MQHKLQLPSGQDWLIERIQKLGYLSSSGGICCGVSDMAMQAILAEELSIFDDRLEHIFTISTEKIAEEINIANINKKNALDFNRLTLSIPAFFDGIELYQQSQHYFDLFPKDVKLTCQNVLVTAPIVIPDKLKKQGGIRNLVFTGAYNKHEFPIYFEELRNSIERNNLTKPFALILHTANHVMTIGYDRINKQWLVIEANHLPTRRFTSSKQIARKILENVWSKNAVIASEICFTVDNEEVVKKCIDDWQKSKGWQDLHKISNEKAALSDILDATWLYQAARYGQTEIVKKLIDAQADINTKFYKGMTPLGVAAGLGHVDIVKLLNKANPDLPGPRNDTPLFFAAQNGYSEIVKILLGVYANLDILLDKTTTPLYIAAQNGNADIVKMLIVDGYADPNIELVDKGSSPLQAAAEAGYTEIVKIILNANANPNLANKKGVTPLFMAAQNGHTEIVNLLLNVNTNPDTVYNVYNLSSLYIVVQNDYAEIIKLLLNPIINADPNIASINDITPLFLAAENGKLEIVKILLTGNINTEIADKKGRTPLFIAAQNKHIEIVKALLKVRANPNVITKDGVSALFIATECADIEIVKLLLDANADPNVGDNHTVPILIAAKTGNTEIVKALLASHANPHHVDGTGASSLSIASQNGNREMVKMLLDANVDINLGDQFNVTPLHKAVQHGHFEIVKMLVDGQANINQQNYEGDTPLLLAIKKGDLEIIKLLLDRQADHNIANNLSFTPLLTAIKTRNLNVLQLLEEYLNASSKYENYRNIHIVINESIQPEYFDKSLLYIASKIGNPEFVKILLDLNMNPNQTDSSNVTPLFIAAQLGHVEILRLLVAACADPDIAINSGELKGETAIFQAVINKNIDILKILLQDAHANLNLARNEDHATPLTIAIELGDLAIVKLLLDSGANPNISSNKGSPLLLASKYNRPDIADLLLTAHADPNQIIQDTSALSLAVLNGHTEIVSVLLNAGANPDIIDINGENPIYVAAKNGYLEIAKMLLDAQANVNQVIAGIKDTPLLIAAKNGYHNIVRLLLQYNPDMTLVFTDSNNSSYVESEKEHSKYRLEIADMLKSHQKILLPNLSLINKYSIFSFANDTKVNKQLSSVLGLRGEALMALA